jgi:hypothetical protein
MVTSVEMTWKGAVRALLYPILFSKDLTGDVDRVLTGVVDRRALGLDREQYTEAIKDALASNEDLSQLLPGGPADDRARQFLAQLLSRLG